MKKNDHERSFLARVFSHLKPKKNTQAEAVEETKLAPFLNVQPDNMLAGRSEAPSGFSESDAEELQQNFLKVSGPDRGEKFKSLIRKISED